jgi:hypothetical protein
MKKKSSLKKKTQGERKVRKEHAYKIYAQKSDQGPGLLINANPCFVASENRARHPQMGKKLICRNLWRGTCIQVYTTGESLAQGFPLGANFKIFGSTEDLTQGLALARQAWYQLVHAPSPFVL